jgi:hypothetical protein
MICPAPLPIQKPTSSIAASEQAKTIANFAFDLTLMNPNEMDSIKLSIPRDRIDTINFLNTTSVLIDCCDARYMK